MDGEAGLCGFYHNFNFLKMERKTVTYEVIADFPWSMHKIGDTVEVLEATHIAYVVQVPDYGDGPGDSEKFDLRDFPNIYRLISA